MIIWDEKPANVSTIIPYWFDKWRFVDAKKKPGIIYRAITGISTNQAVLDGFDNTMEIILKMSTTLDDVYKDDKGYI